MKQWFLILVIALLCGCSPRVTERILVERDSVYFSIARVDSLVLTDSVFVNTYLKGDTVFQDRIKTVVRERVQRVVDTVYIHRTDTIQITIPTGNEQGWLDKLQSKLEGGVVLLFALAIGILLLKYALRK